MKTLTTLGFILALSTAVPGQSSLLTHYTTEEGLPSNGIKGMEWDAERQLLWLATEAGVVRFNGRFFTVFHQENTPWLRSNRTGYLGRTRSGALFGSGEKGVLFEINGLEPIPNTCLENEHLLSTEYYSIFDDPLSLDPAELVPWEGLERVYRWTILGFQDERLFLSSGSTLYAFCAGMTAPVPYDTLFPNAQVFEIGEHILAMDQQGQFWSYRPAGKQLQRVSAPGVEEICRRGQADPQGFRIIWNKGQQTPILLCGSTAWALRMVQGGLCAEFISDAVPAHNNYTFAHYWEEGRQLFLATDAKGFYQIRQPMVQQLTEPRYGDPTLSKATYSQILLSSGNIITQAGQIFGEHPQNKGPDWFGRGNIGRNVHIHPNDKDLLFSCQDTLYHCSGRADSCRPLFGLHGLDRSAFYPLGEELWIAYRGSPAAPGGFLRFRKDSIEHRYTFDKPSQKLPHFYKVFPWDGNQFAVATCSGLWLVDTLSRRLDTLPGTEGLCIRTTWRYKDYLFLGTYGDGIWVYRNGRLTVLPLDPKKHLLHAHCFQPDAYGFVWISTNHGLFRVHLDDLLDAADGLDQQVFYRYFGLREGMSLTEMNGGCNPCALELPDGRLSFPTMDGLLWVDPAKVSHTFTQPGLYFGSVQAGEYEYAGRPEIRFPKTIREATIELEYSYFGNSENNYLSYRLLPDQPEWALVDARSPHELRLTGLSPGTHRLQLKKLNGYDLFAQRELTLHIPYPWYMSWYAFLLYATGLGLAIWVISKLSTVQYQRRQRELEARIAEKTWEVQEKNSALEANIRQLRRQQTILNQVNQLKNRLVSILNHDIITPLRFLHLTGRNLVQNSGRMSGELQEELLTEIAHTAEELQHLSTNILNWIRYQDLGQPELIRRETNLYELAEQVKKLLAAPARSKGTRIVNAVPPGAVVHIPAEPFQIMLYNLVSNSLKFTQGGEIELGIQQGEDSWNLYVRDTGLGMSKAQVDNILHSDFVHSTAGPDQVRGHGLGFLIIRELVQLMGGRLQVESEPGRGTVVVIALPARPGESVPGGPLVRPVLPSEKG